MSVGTGVALISFLSTIAVLRLLLGAQITRGEIVTTFVVLAVLVGLVFVNPFGVVARESQIDPRPTTPTYGADAATRWIEIAGIPVAWFKPYRQDYLYSGENAPTAALKLHYGFSVLPSTGSSTVVAMCAADIFDPCWKDGQYPLLQVDRSGKTWIVPLSETIFGNPIRYLHVAHFYDVHVGVVSPDAWIYWLLVAFAVVFAAFRRSVRWRVVALSLSTSVAAASLVAAALAAAGTPQRSASEQEPSDLVPQAKPVETTTRSATATSLTDQRWGRGCVTRSNGKTTYYCSLANQLTAARVARGILAVWTASPHQKYESELRARPLSGFGIPLNPSRVVLSSWPVSRRMTNPGGPIDCSDPGDVQATSMTGDRVLIAWSDSCAIYSRGPDQIHGVVVDANGRRLGAPFTIASVLPSNDEGPWFALGSTAAGRPLLAWVARPRGSLFGQAIFASFLDSDGHVTGVHELYAQPGRISIACTASCAVAVGVSSPHSLVHLMFVGADGGLDSSRDVPVGAGGIPVLSAPALAAHGADFYVGWIESPTTVTGTAKIARIQLGGRVTISTVWPNFSTGHRDPPTTPTPLGVGFVGTKPVLVWQVLTGSGRTQSGELYFASATSRHVRRFDPFLGESVTPGSPAAALLAIGALVPYEPEPLAIPLARQH